MTFESYIYKQHLVIRFDLDRLSPSVIKGRCFCTSELCFQVQTSQFHAISEWHFPPNLLALQYKSKLVACMQCRICSCDIGTHTTRNTCTLGILSIYIIKLIDFDLYGSTALSVPYVLLIHNHYLWFSLCNCVTSVLVNYDACHQQLYFRKRGGAC